MPKYTRGKSGYSVQDENAAKEYGQRDYKISQDSPLKHNQSEREYRRDVGGPNNYLRNTKTEEGREVNRKNVNTQDEDRKFNGRPPMSRKWIE